MDQPDQAEEGVARVCRELIERLVAEGLPKPSVYLRRGDRLRIQAVEGYHQIFDGMPVGVGVIGRTFSTGRTTLVEDVLDDEHYLRANPGVRAEVSVPVRAGGEVVGVLNVESPEPFPPGTVERVEAEAAQLGRRIAGLGLAVAESAAQRLVRHAIQLGELTERAEIHLEAIAAARDVAEMDSAALLLPTGDGTMTLAAVDGPLASAIAAAAPEDVAAIAALVANGCSSYTVGGTEDTGAELAALRASGAEAVIAVPLPRRRGVLLVVDGRPLTPRTDTVELLEALAAQIASCLRTITAHAELRERAATDPLTGLGHPGTFHDALARTRARREAFAVLVADIDGFKAINDTQGHQAGDRLLRETAAALATALRRGDELFRIGGDEFAAIIRVADEAEALAAGERLRTAAGERGDLTLSVGMAMPRPSEGPDDVLARADAALYRVKGRGRDGVALLS